MGTDQYFFNNNQNYNKLPNKINLSKSLFEFLYVIGRGGFGKVWKVLLKKTSNHYALKEMSKMKIILKRSEKSIQSERDLLSNLYHPFIVNMISAFQDFNNLYLVMDLFKGGDMRYHLFIHKKFNEMQSKFFCANIILGLEYLHKNKIIHRDIKPENLVLDENGYLAITDFGIAKKIEKSSKPDASGTPGYMAPEVLFSQIHSFYVDFYAVGVIAFEFMNGFRPYQGRDRKEIKEAILARQAGVGDRALSSAGWSREGGDFINRMIKRKVRKRLGFYGINEIKNHAWFKGLNWDKLLMKKIKTPYIPKEGDNFDKKFCEGTDNFFEEINVREKYNNFLKQNDYMNIFINYTFLREEEKAKVLNDFYDNDKNQNFNSNMNKELKKSLSKIIQINKKNQIRPINNNYMMNNENKNILNFNYDSILKNPELSYFATSKNNAKVFHKKRASKDSRINTISKNSKNTNNNIIIINPHYNQNINYFSNDNKNISKNNNYIDLSNEEISPIKQVYSFKRETNPIKNKRKSYDHLINKDTYENGELNSNYNHNYNTIDIKKTKNNNKINDNNILTYKKNLSPKLHSSSSMKTINYNYDLQRMNDANANILNKINKERLIYSPPHIQSPRLKNSSSTRNKNICYNNDNQTNNNFGTLDHLHNFNNKSYNGIKLKDKSEYNTINYNNFYEIEKNMIMNKIENRHIANNKLNKSDINLHNNINNYCYSTLNKFYNRKNSEIMIYSSFTSKSKAQVKHRNTASSIFNNNPICLYNSNINRNYGKNKNILTDRNNFNKSRRIKNIIESYSKKNRDCENIDNKTGKIGGKKPRKFFSFMSKPNKRNENLDNYKTINNINNDNIVKIKVNLIPKPHMKGEIY